MSDFTRMLVMVSSRVRCGLNWYLQTQTHSHQVSEVEVGDVVHDRLHSATAAFQMKRDVCFRVIDEARYCSRRD